MFVVNLVLIVYLANYTTEETSLIGLERHKTVAINFMRTRALIDSPQLYKFYSITSSWLFYYSCFTTSCVCLSQIYKFQKQRKFFFFFWRYRPVPYVPSIYFCFASRFSSFCAMIWFFVCLALKLVKFFFVFCQHLLSKILK